MLNKNYIFGIKGLSNVFLCHPTISCDSGMDNLDRGKILNSIPIPVGKSHKKFPQWPHPHTHYAQHTHATPFHLQDNPLLHTAKKQIQTHSFGKMAQDVGMV